MASDVFHAGEIAVQERAGVRSAAAELGEHAIAPQLDVTFAVFLRDQYLLIAGGRDGDGRVWASPILGPRGFARTAGPGTLVLHAAFQRRTPVQLLDDGRPGTEVTTAHALNADQRTLVHAADTFSTATANAQRGADASHRGGRCSSAAAARSSGTRSARSSRRRRLRSPPSHRSSRSARYRG